MENTDCNTKEFETQSGLFRLHVISFFAVSGRRFVRAIYVV